MSRVGPIRGPSIERHRGSERPSDPGTEAQTPMPSSTQSIPRRSLGRRSLVFISVGAVIGSGWLFSSFDVGPDRRRGWRRNRLDPGRIARRGPGLRPCGARDDVPGRRRNGAFSSLCLRAGHRVLFRLVCLDQRRLVPAIETEAALRYVGNYVPSLIYAICRRRAPHAARSARRCVRPTRVHRVECSGHEVVPRDEHRRRLVENRHPTHRGRRLCRPRVRPPQLHRRWALSGRSTRSAGGRQHRRRRLRSARLRASGGAGGRDQASPAQRSLGRHRLSRDRQCPSI